MERIYFYLKNKFYDWNYACSCGCNDFDEIVKDRIDYMVTEYQEVCTKCGREVGYWAYGHYTYPRCRTEEFQYRWYYFKERVKSFLSSLKRRRH